MKMMYRFIPISVVAGLMLATYLAGFYQVVDFETLRYLHVEMIEFVNNSPIMTPVMFVGYCAGATVLSMPGGLMLSVLAGFLFAQPWCTVYFLMGMATGASLLFLSLKMALGGLSFKKLDAHLERHSISYLLFLRLVPFVPFWIANFIPAFFNVRLRTYFWTTVVGMLPKVLILTEAGKGFNTVFESAEGFSVQTVFNGDVQIILGCLAIFSLLPILIRKLAREEEVND